MANNLQQVDGVGSAVASKLEDSGFASLEDIKKEDATVEDLRDAGAPKNAAKNLVRTARKNAIMIQSGDEVYKRYQSMERMPSGIERLDEILNGGWENGHAVAIGGETGSGKTQLAYQSLGNAVKETGDAVVYLETEPGRYRGDRIREMFDPQTQSKVYKVGPIRNLDQQKVAYQTVMDLEEEVPQIDNISLVVVDSFTARFRLGRFNGRENFTGRSEEMKEHLNLIEEMAASLDVPVLLNCQVYEAPSQYQNEPIIYGGSLMMHMVNYVIKLLSRSGAMSELCVRNHPSQGDEDFRVQINQDGMEFVSGSGN